MDGNASVAVSSVLSTMFVFCICFVFCFLQLAVHLSCSEGALCVNQSQLSAKLADHVHAQDIIIAIPITLTITITYVVGKTLKHVCAIFGQWTRKYCFFHFAVKIEINDG